MPSILCPQCVQHVKVASVGGGEPVECTSCGLKFHNRNRNAAPPAARTEFYIDAPRRPGLRNWQYWSIVALSVAVIGVMVAIYVFTPLEERAANRAPTSLASRAPSAAEEVADDSPENSQTQALQMTAQEWSLPDDADVSDLERMVERFEQTTIAQTDLPEAGAAEVLSTPEAGVAESQVSDPPSPTVAVDAQRSPSGELKVPDQPGSPAAAVPEPDRQVAMISRPEKKPEPPPMPKFGRFTDMVMRVRRATFHLHVVDGEGREMAAGTAFVVSEDGLALTNFQLTSGAYAAYAEPADPSLPKRFDVELESVEPALDLALIRLIPPVTAPPDTFAPMVFSDTETTVPQSVWAAGFAFDQPYALAPGNTVIFFRGALDQMRDVRPWWEKNARWIATDLKIDAGFTGGPLIDTDGRVVGVNSWLLYNPPKGGRPRFQMVAAPARQVKAFLAQPQSSSLTFARALDIHNALMTPHGMPRVAIAEPATWRDLMHRTNLSMRITQCVMCDGIGIRRYRVQTGTSSNGAIAFREMGVAGKPCTRCRATGVAGSQINDKFLGALIRCVAAQDETDDDARKTLLLFERTMNRILAGTWKTVTATLNPFKITSDMIGGPMTLVGTPLRIDGADGFMHAVELPDGRQALLVDPKVAPSLEGDRAPYMVFVGGLFAGQLSIDRKEPMLIIQGAFVVPIEMYRDEQLPTIPSHLLRSE